MDRRRERVADLKQNLRENADQEGEALIVGRKLRIAGEIGQWFTAAIVLAGILAEWKYKADVCFFMITSGTFLWAVVQKIKHPTRHKEDD